MHQPKTDHRTRSSHERASVYGFRHRARGHSESDKPTERSKRLQTLIEDLATGHLKNDINFLSSVSSHNRCGEICFCRINDGVRPKRCNEFAFIGRGCTSDNFRTPEFCQLHCDGANATGGGMNQHALAALKVRTGAEQMHCSGPLQNGCERRSIAYSIWNWKSKRLWS